MTLREILAVKGNAVLATTADATLRSVAKELIHHRIGALLVFDRDSQGRTEQLLGIITERDLLRVCAANDTPLERIRVAEVMSTNLIKATPDDSVDAVMGLMTRERIRHLPVVAEGKVVGVISIGDVVKWQHDHLAIENRFMKDYIRG